jgi:hypothetical protein
MKAIKKLEVFSWAPKDRYLEFITGRRPVNYWVCSIIGADWKYGLNRQFLKPEIDMSEANSKLSRGVFAKYILETDKVYEIQEQTSWRCVRRYFAIVTDDGFIDEISKDEVDEWVKNIPDWTYSIPPE